MVWIVDSYFEDVRYVKNTDPNFYHSLAETP